MSNFGIPKHYSGHKMRSKTETNVARLLDRLAIKWRYEPDKIELKTQGHYIPDFYITEHNQWIEVKGRITSEAEQKAEELAKKTGKEIIILGHTQCRYYNKAGKNQIISCQDIHLTECSDCGNISLVPELYDWRCRKCGYPNGDQGLIRKKLYQDEEFSIETDAHIRKFLISLGV